MTYDNNNPEAAAPKTEVLTIRTSRLDRYLIAAAAAAERVTISAFVRRAAIATAANAPGTRQKLREMAGVTTGGADSD